MQFHSFWSPTDTCRRPRSTTTKIEGYPVSTCIALEPPYRERGEDVGLLRVLRPTLKPLELSLLIPLFSFLAVAQLEGKLFPPRRLSFKSIT